AGYDKSKAAIALSELIKRSGHEVVGIVIVTPFSVKRLHQLILQRGKEGLKTAIKKLLPGFSSSGGGVDYLARYLEELGIVSRSLSHWAKNNAVPCKVVENINSKESINFVSGKNIDALIYGGGGLLRKPLIDAANQTIINPHCGPLPEIRGMNAIEWAFLLGFPLDVTVHFIDKGIDTGEIISRVPLTFNNDISMDELRAKAVISGITEIHRLLTIHDSIESLPRQKNVGIVAGRQCYIMAPALQELVAIRLQR
ncbi:MAG: hypothetical protein KAI17_04585, partial [Thiotrichaceae bacterium]|nr:hypothetical protein [Thiotrichaceae bacterium]